MDYDTVAAAAADQVRFVEEGRFDFVQGQVRFGEAGRRVFLETAAYSGGDLFYLEFQHRLDAAEALLTGTGAWFHPHPWWNCFLPASAALGFLTALVERLTPADLGPAGCVLFYPVFTGEVHAPLVRLPAERIDFLVAILRFPPDDAGLVARQVAENRRLYEEARAGPVHLPGRRDPLHAGGLAPPLRLAVAFAVRVEVALRPGRGADPRAGDLLAPGQFFREPREAAADHAPVAVVPEGVDDRFRRGEVVACRGEVAEAVVDVREVQVQGREEAVHLGGIRGLRDFERTEVREQLATRLVLPVGEEVRRRRSGRPRSPPPRAATGCAAPRRGPSSSPGRVLLRTCLHDAPSSDCKVKQCRRRVSR
ncbi:hypothetical protein [Amycolatopsis methanolica]|uniref:hypothetical protein n=1 Tax=Amycolatopsis methanolica TaxID=1814 RepID=UPI003F4D898A